MNDDGRSIEQLKGRAINQALIALSALATLTTVLTFFRTLEYGSWSIFVVQVVALALLLFTTIIRNRLSLLMKVYFLVFIILITVVSGLYGMGFMASGKIYVAFVPVLMSFLVSYRKALISLIVFTLIYCLFAFLYVTGKIEYTYDLNAYASSLRTWAIDLIVICLTSWGLLFLVYYFGNALSDNYLVIEKQNKELIDNEKKYRTLFESSVDAILLIKNKRFFDCNSAAFKMFQCDKDCLIGREPFEMSPEFQPDGIRSEDKANFLFSKVSGGEPQVFDWQHKRCNGEYFDVSVSLNLIDVGKAKYIQAVLRDITEKKQIEKELEEHRNELKKLIAERTLDLEEANNVLKATNYELSEKNQIIRNQNSELKSTMHRLKVTQSNLIQAEKMASLGVLTSGVSHEINNPLNFILGGYIGLETYFNEPGRADNEEIQFLLKSIKTGIDRTSSIIKGLNQFSRNNENFREECDIHTIINNCLVILNNQYKDRIEINKNFTFEAIIIYGNSGKLHQAIISLLTNSIHAIESTGQITIATRVEEKNVFIEIMDSGEGISKKNLPKITDPFFTTKEPGKGTGLGLFITRTILEQHSGTLNIRSKIGVGTQVEIILPRNKV